MKSLLVPALVKLAIERAKSSAARAARQAALFTVAGLLASVAVGFLLAAAYLQLERSYNPVVAALSVGLALLVIAGSIAFAAGRIGTASRPVSTRPPAAAPATPPVLPDPSLAGSRAAMGQLSLPMLAFSVGVMLGSGGRNRK